MNVLPVRAGAGAAGSREGRRALWLRIVPLAAFLVALALLRSIFLAHDPPAELVEWGLNVGEFLYDEGWWTANARDHAVFGEWLSGEFDPIIISPISSLLFRASFLFLGQGLVQARVVSVVLGMAGLVLLFSILRRTSGEKGAFWGVLLVGLYMPVLIAHRTALLESSALFFAILSVWLWMRGPPSAHVGSGLAMAAAMLTKPTAIIVAIPLCIAALWVPARSRRREVLSIVGGLVAGGLVWWLVWGLVHPGNIIRMVSFYAGPRWRPIPMDGGAAASILKMGGTFLLGGLMWRHVLFSANPAFILLALAGATRCLGRRHESADERRLRILALLWLMGGGFLLSLSPYQPMRYFVLLSPSMAVLAASIVLPARGDGRLSRGESLLALVLVAAVASQMAYWLTFGIVRRWLGRLDLPQRSIVDPEPFSLTSALLSLPGNGIRAAFQGLYAQDGLLLGAGLAALAALAIGLPVALLVWRMWLWRRATGNSGWIEAGGRLFLVLALVSAGTDLVRFGSWASSSRATVRALGRTLSRILPEDAVVSPGGTYALGTELRFDNSCLLRRRMWSLEPPATHVLVLLAHPLVGSSPARDFVARHPEVRFVQQFETFGGRAELGLFAIDRDASQSAGDPPDRGAIPPRPEVEKQR